MHPHGFMNPELSMANTKSPEIKHPKQIQSIQIGAAQKTENKGTCGNPVCGVHRRQVEATKAMPKMAVHRFNRLIISESVASTMLGLDLNPITGALANSDTSLTFAAGDPNAGANPNIVGAAYSNSVANAPNTVLYDIDSDKDINDIALGITAVPEPSSLGLVSIFAFSFAMGYRKRRANRGK